MGLYIQPSARTVRYRAYGHADEFLRSWIDTIVALSVHTASPGTASQVANVPLERLYKTLASPFSTGRCLKCHTIDKKLGTPIVNWIGASSARQFTKFSHVTHFTAVESDGCAQCHVLKEDRYGRP